MLSDGMLAVMNCSALALLCAVALSEPIPEAA